MAASFKERRDSLKNKRFKSVKLVSFLAGPPREENMYEVWYQPSANIVSLYQSNNINVPLMSMPYKSFVSPRFSMSPIRWPESVMLKAVNAFRTLTKEERKRICDSLPLNTFMLEGVPGQLAPANIF